MVAIPHVIALDQNIAQLDFYGVDVGTRSQSVTNTGRNLDNASSDHGALAARKRKQTLT